MEYASCERELDWNDEIENDSPEFILLPPGDYDFTVASFERERYPGGAKLPPCTQAVLSIAIDTPEGRAVIRHNLFLHSKCEGFLCEFFSSIGQRRHGERLRMNWSRVVGSRGRCKVGVREWVSNRDGEKKQGNEIKKFYEAAEKSAPGFQAGEF